jgi:hypothetical protein
MFPQMFPCLPTMETLLRKQNFLPEKQKCFLANSETFVVCLCFSLMFPSVCPLWETWRNIGRKQCFRNNVSQFAKGFTLFFKIFNIELSLRLILLIDFFVLLMTRVV